MVDDHVLFARSLSVALEAYDDIGQFYSVQEIREPEKMIREKDIDIVLMDINLGRTSDKDGLETAACLIKSNPGLKTVILTGYDLPVYRHEAKKAGVSGFLNKNISPDALVSALRSVMAGKSCFPPDTNDNVIEELTAMEKKILQLIGAGMKRKTVSGELHISERTLSNHLQHIFEKLDAASTVEAVTKAIRFGYISPLL